MVVTPQDFDRLMRTAQEQRVPRRYGTPPQQIGGQIPAYGGIPNVYSPQYAAGQMQSAYEQQIPAWQQALKQTTYGTQKRLGAVEGIGQLPMNILQQGISQQMGNVARDVALEQARLRDIAEREARAQTQPALLQYYLQTGERPPGLQLPGEMVTQPSYTGTPGLAGTVSYERGLPVTAAQTGQRGGIAGLLAAPERFTAAGRAAAGLAEADIAQQEQYAAMARPERIFESLAEEAKISNKPYDIHRKDLIKWFGTATPTAAQLQQKIQSGTAHKKLLKAYQKRMTEAGRLALPGTEYERQYALARGKQYQTDAGKFPSWASGLGGFFKNLLGGMASSVVGGGFGGGGTTGGGMPTYTPTYGYPAAASAMAGFGAGYNPVYGGMYGGMYGGLGR
jgi:hypothetical protein